jgi:lipopolysaccharide heptosyltransferase II
MWTESAPRILLSRMKFIGDVVLTTPLIRSVRSTLPQAHIAYLGDRTAVTLLENNPFLNEIIPYDFSRSDVAEQTRVALLLRRRKFDIAIDLFGNPRSALLMFLSGAPVRVGPDRHGRGRLYTVRVRNDERPMNAIEFHNQYLRAAGISPSSTRTEIFLTEEERRRGREEIARALGLPAGPLAERTVIGIHPGATWPAKKWFPERFARLARELRAHPGTDVVLTAGPRDEETITAVQAASPEPLPVLRGLGLRRLASAIAGCSAYVTNDAGPLHIAVAVGTPTVGLFGPGEERIWFPYPSGGGHRALRKDVPCHPCHLDTCNRTGTGYRECMELLSVEEVAGAVARALQGRS